MSETTTNTRGRKPKEIEDTTQVDFTVMMREMQEQIIALQNKLNEANNEKTDLETLVSALKGNKSSNDDILPKKVKVISLVPNQYNLSTQGNGQGKVFTFDRFGDMVTMKRTELEDILSVQAYRRQAENGYFYIADEAVVEDQELSDVYETIANKEALERVMTLEDDKCVDIFCGLDKTMQESLASKMAEKINDGSEIDYNRLNKIARKCDIDIIKMAQQFKEIDGYRKNKED